MHVTRLPVGQHASEADDCIRIKPREDGQYMLECSVLDVAEDDTADSVAVIGSEPYPSYEAAEAAGLAWAAERGVAQLYVTRDG